MSAEPEVHEVVAPKEEVMAEKAQEVIYEVDYDKDITHLYESITNEDWDSALEAVALNPLEARTWVVRYNEENGGGGVMWRFLPIHSACARQPPSQVLSVLLDAFAEGVSLEDDQGM